LFGYIKPEKAELKIKEYETYKAVYCTVCKTLGKEYGIFSRFLLTYDAAFYVLVLKCLLQDGCDRAERGVCRFNPFKKCFYIPADSILRQSAALTVIMFYYKVRDGLRDSGNFRKFLYYLLYPYISFKFKKAVKNYSYFDDIIKLSVERQTEAESDFECSVDRACDPSASALAEIFSYGIQDEEVKRILSRIGYCVGRWVYLADAFDDLEKDVKNGNFNPFAIKYGLDRNNISDITDDVYDGIAAALRLSANEAAGAFDLAKHKSYASVCENIIYDGTEAQLNRLINKKRCSKHNG